MAESSEDPTLVLCTGSGALLVFGPADGNSRLEPLTLDCSSLTQIAPTSWVEQRPNGFKLCYGELTALGEGSPGAGAPVSPAPPAGECPTLTNDQGFTRNNLPRGYAVPFVGVPQALEAGLGSTGQPALCAIDEWTACNSNNGRPQYLPTDLPTALDQSCEMALRYAHGVLLDCRRTGNHLGRADAVCLVNLSSGNLCVSILLPSAGPAAPPLRLTYNSLAPLRYDCGFGWMTNFHAHVRTSSGWRFLYKVESLSGSQWNVQRAGIDGPIDKIVDPAGGETTFAYAGSDLTQIEDSAGRITGFAVDSNGDLVAITLPDGGTIELTYDSDHRLIAWTNPQGDTTGFIYECGLLSGIILPGSKTTTFEYPATATRTLIDAIGQTTTFTVGSDQNISAVEFPSVGASTVVNTYTWDALQRIASFIDGNGHATTFTYQAMNDRTSRLATIARPSGTFAWDWNPAAPGLRSVVDPVGSRSTLTWDAYQNRTQFTDPLSNTWTTTYSPDGQIVANTTPTGDTTTYSYDAAKRLASVMNYIQEATTYTYAGDNTLSSAANVADWVSTFTHDAMNRLTTAADPAGDITTYVYDGNGRQIAVEQPEGLTCTTIYDLTGKPVAEIGPAGIATTYLAYDDVLNLVQLQPPGLGTSTMTYNPAGQVVTLTKPGSGTVTNTYDNAGNRIAESTPTGGTTTTTFDSADRPVATILPTGDIVTTVYDANDRVVATINALGQVTTIVRNALGLPTSVVQSNSSTFTMAYDQSGRPTASEAGGARSASTTYGKGVEYKDRTTTSGADQLAREFAQIAGSVIEAATQAAGATTTTKKLPQRMEEVIPPWLVEPRRSTYDGAKRVRYVEYPSGARVTYAYDLANLLETIATESGVQTYLYDAGGRVTHYSSPCGVIVTHSYGLNGNRTGTTLSNYGELNYSHDSQGRVSSIGTPAGTITLTRDMIGRVIERQYPNGVTTTQTLDPAGRILGITHRVASTIVERFTCTYDSRGNRLSEAAIDGTQTTWTYDALGQLLSERRDGGPPSSSYCQTHTYDARGNRILTNDGGMLTTYTYSGNRLASYQTFGDVTTMSYDAGGHRTCKEDPESLTTFTWNEAGYLSSIESTSTVTLTYDAQGRLASFTAADALTNVIYDGDALLQECNSNATPIRTYVNLNEGGSPEILCDADGLVPLFDAAGNTVRLIDAAGVTRARYQYSAFGMLLKNETFGANIVALTVDEWASLSVDELATIPLTLSTPILFAGQRGMYGPADLPVKIPAGLSARPLDSLIGQHITPMTYQEFEKTRFCGNPYAYRESNPVLSAGGQFYPE